MSSSLRRPSNQESLRVFVHSAATAVVLFEGASGSAPTDELSRIVSEYDIGCGFGVVDLGACPSTPGLFELVRSAIPSQTLVKPGFYFFRDGTAGDFEQAYKASGNVAADILNVTVGHFAGGGAGSLAVQAINALRRLLSRNPPR